MLMLCRVEHCIKKSRICEELSNTLRNELKEVFGDSFVDLKFAVRSSAIGNRLS